MTEQERKDEFWAAKKEAEEAGRNVRCLLARAGRYRAKLEYLVDRMTTDLTEEHGVNNHPDLSGWPTQSEIAGLFDDFYKERRTLHNTTRRMEQFWPPNPYNDPTRRVPAVADACFRAALGAIASSLRSPVDGRPEPS